MIKMPQTSDVDDFFLFPAFDSLLNYLHILLYIFSGHGWWYYRYIYCIPPCAHEARCCGAGAESTHGGNDLACRRLRGGMDQCMRAFHYTFLQNTLSFSYMVHATLLFRMVPLIFVHSKTKTYKTLLIVCCTIPCNALSYCIGLMVTFGSLSETSTEIRKYSRDLYSRLEAETGLSTGFNPVGER